MKAVSQKCVVMGSDFAGYELKEFVRQHLAGRGWQVTDLTPQQDTAPMYHRVGFLVGAQISEGLFERGLVFCGTGMGSHVAAGKCPRVQAGVAESISAAQRASAANNCNVLAMGSFWVGPQLGAAMADAFLGHSLGQGYEDWPGFYEYHLRGWQECEDFDYEAYKERGFKVMDESVPYLGPAPACISY